MSLPSWIFEVNIPILFIFKTRMSWLYMYRFLFWDIKTAVLIHLCLFSLHINRNYFIYHSCCSRFMGILCCICICGKKLIPSSRYIPSIHHGPLLPISFLPGWMLTSPLCGCSLQWIFVSIAFYDVSSVEAPSLSVMTSEFISISENGLLSYFNPWFKIHFRPISNFLSISLSRYAVLTSLSDVLNGVAVPVRAMQYSKSIHFWNIPARIWFIILSLPLYLFNFLSLECTFLIMIKVALNRSIPPVP